MEEKIEIKGMKIIDENTIEVTTKDGIFIMEDPVSDDLSRAIKRNRGSEIYGILSTMIVQKDGSPVKLGELSIKKFRGSTITKLQAVADKLLGGEDFLSEDENSKKMNYTE